MGEKNDIRGVVSQLIEIIRKYTSQICTTIFIIMILVFMIFMTRVNIRYDQTPAIDDNARLETLTGIVSSDYANVSQRSFTIKCGEYDYYSPGGETLDEINQKYDLNLDYGDSITAECEVFTYEIFPAEITILSVSTD